MKDNKSVLAASIDEDKISCDFLNRSMPPVGGSIDI